MSGGKKKYPKKRTYSESELKRAVRSAVEDSVAKLLFLCVVAARDEFDMDEEKTIKFTDTMKRYIEYEDQGLISIKDASKSLEERTGISLKIKR